MVLSVDPGEKDWGPGENEFGPVELFSCQEKTLECQEKTENGHSKLGFECKTKRKGLGTKRKRIRVCLAILLSFSPARRKRLSARRKQKMVILSLVLSVETEEKDWGPRENEFWTVLLFSCQEKTFECQ